MSGFVGEFLFCPGRVDMNGVRRMSQGLRCRVGDGVARECPTYEHPAGRFGVGGCPDEGNSSASHQPLAPASPSSFAGQAGSPSPVIIHDSAAFPGLGISPDGLHTVVLAGEIYNARQLRQELAQSGVTLRTSDNIGLSNDTAKSTVDAALLVALYRLYGREVVGHLRGRFAFALYDAQRQTLLLVRDRLGEKTLWYAWLGDRIVFASEGKALASYPSLRENRSIRPSAIVEYTLLGYIPHPGTLYENVYKLSPGNKLECYDGRVSPERYWWPSLVELPASPRDRAELVRSRIGQAVQLCMATDATAGVLLSGGVDSAIVAALMAKQAGRTGGVRTFTAGFAVPRFDERPAARRVAEFLGTQHAEILITPDPVAMLDRLVERHDEPFGDSSAIPTHIMCQAARQHVATALTGDGGDEVFGGYDRYRAMMLAAHMTSIQYLFIRLAAGTVKWFAPHDERSRLRRLIRFSNGLTKPFASQYFGYRALFQEEDIGRLFTESFAETTDFAAVPAWFTALYEGDDETPEFDNEAARAQYHDLMTYLPDDLLVKSDVSATANSLNLRAPLLDGDLVNIGLSLPPDQKIKNRRGKAILRDLFADCLPPGHLAGTKRGFGVPLGDWLRNELSSQLRETLLDKKFLNRGIFNPLAIHGLVNDHLSGRDDHRHRLWAILVLAKWLDKND